MKPSRKEKPEEIHPGYPSAVLVGVWIRNYLIPPFLIQPSITCQSFCIIYQTRAILGANRDKKGTEEILAPSLWGI